MHRDLHKKGKGLSLEDRGESVPVMAKFMRDNYDKFKAIGPLISCAMKTSSCASVRCEKVMLFLAGLSVCLAGKYSIDRIGLVCLEVYERKTKLISRSAKT